MRVILRCKLAEHDMDGVDVRGREVGEVLDLPPAQARLLVAENWAVHERRRNLHVPLDGGRRASDSLSAAAPAGNPEGRAVI